MSVTANTGEIEWPEWPEAKILWKIHDYFLLSQKADSYIESPIFPCGGSTWCLQVYPNGSRAEKSVGFVGFSIKRINPDKDIEMTFHLKMIDYFGFVFAEKLSTSSTFDKSLTNGIGWKMFIKRDLLLANTKGTLTIKLVMKILKTAAATVSEISDGVCTLVRDFKFLLTSKQKSDVVNIVENRAFRAHRLTLGARSTAFAAMFEHNVKKNYGVVVVNIVICDADAFEDFLSFMYTGKMGEMSSDKAINLYYLAEKYAISDLKKICLDFMGKNLSLTNVCDILTIANNFNVSSTLKKSAEELLGNNLKSVMKTDCWIEFMLKNPKLVTEILMKYT